jgi:tetratricopeptide (TPR) repeat protein
VNKNIFFILSLCCLLYSCGQSDVAIDSLYSTSSDSTLYYYQKGWQQIMDQGFYGPAEVSYRKALEFDPDFLVGKSVLARLTTDLEERLQLFEELEAQKGQITGDERLILDVYIALTEFTNIREQEPDKAPEYLQKALRLADANFRQIVPKYPNEVYLKAEYIEILHSLQGPKASLDSLNALTTDQQKDNPFLLGYAAGLNAELGNYQMALVQANRLSHMTQDSLIPKPYVVYADIHYKWRENLELAKQMADRAVKLDPRNLDASRLKAKIEEALDNKNTKE